MIKNKIAQYASYLFVPPTFTLLLFVWTALNYEKEKSIPIVLSLLLTLIIPIAIFILFKKFGKVQDYDASIKEERTTLYNIGIILCLVGFVFSKLMLYSTQFTSIWVIYVINTTLLIQINKQWKISAHMIGISAPMAALFYFNSIFAYYLIPIAIILAWARLRLKMHTVAQIVAGFLFGFLLTLLQLIIFGSNPL